MRILDRYVCREVVSNSLLGLVVFTFVFFVPQLVRLMSLVVQHAATFKETATLLLSSLTPVLIFTLPMSMLVGVLIGLGRLSADSEIVALNASGIGLRRLLVPVGAIAITAMALTFCITLWLGPYSLQTLESLENRLRVTQASVAIQPRVFDERFPHIVLYVQDVGASGTRWRGVFLAESNSSAGSKVTLAKSAIVIGDARQGKLTLQLNDVSTHEFDPKNPAQYNLSTSAVESIDLPVANPSSAAANSRKTLSDRERSIGQLLSVKNGGMRDARVELQQRFAFPVACVLFALLGIPMAVRPRRGGRAGGFVVAILLICGYYLFFVTGVHFAQDGILPPGIGVWTANIVTFAVAVILLRRLEQIRPEARWLDRLRSEILRIRKSRREDRHPSAVAVGARVPLQIERSRPSEYHTRAFPLIFDLYVLRTFVYWLAIMLAGFMILFDAFTLFDLLGDIAKNHIALSVVVSYFLHLAPMMVYQLAPLAALVATLVTLGLLAKNNEITALKASGVSLFRLSLPLILAGALLTSGMFLLDDTFLPYANQRQDALHDQIKGRPAQTYFQPAHQWIFGENDKIYNYELFDPYDNLFGGLNVFELDPSTFQMRRRIYATRSYWEPNLNSWVLERGWVRDFSGATVTSYKPFVVDSFPEFSERPTYFKREVFQYNQMNWRQLRNYIRGLQKAGFQTSRLSIEWHKKFAFPLMSTIIILMSIPFALLVGTRGAVGGVALAIGIAIGYWAIAALFEAMGAVGQLPAFLAAWAPDAIFAFVGLYFFLKMPT
ncbi:MAG TPA: LPS export ABC transporter permease LptF [Candidatus Acidoferrales bacterium]|nr:LPS export ABC transporter permease LptF [Candidatus Acidoferrales bacterium]